MGDRRIAEIGISIGWCQNTLKWTLGCYAKSVVLPSRAGRHGVGWAQAAATGRGVSILASGGGKTLLIGGMFAKTGSHLPCAPGPEANFAGGFPEAVLGRKARQLPWHQQVAAAHHFTPAAPGPRRSLFFWGGNSPWATCPGRVCRTLGTGGNRAGGLALDQGQLFWHLQRASAAVVLHQHWHVKVCTDVPADGDPFSLSFRASQTHTRKHTALQCK